MKETWQCPFCGKYVEKGEKCPQCRLAEKEAYDYAIASTEDEDEYYEEMERMYEEAVNDFNRGSF